LSEFTSLNILAEETMAKMMTRGMMGFSLDLLKEDKLAAVAFSDAIELLAQVRGEVPEQYDTFELDRAVILKIRWASALLTIGEVEKSRNIVDEIEKEIDTNPESIIPYRELQFDLARKTGDAAAMLKWATLNFNDIEKRIEVDDSTYLQDFLAEAHFRLGIAMLKQADKDSTAIFEMFRHFIAQLRIKIKIGKLTGVATGLSNVASFISVIDPILAGAMLLTAEQISLEVGTAKDSENDEWSEPIIQQFLSTPQNIKAGISLISISDKLQSYYLRALERRLGPRYEAIVSLLEDTNG
jgi:hypothetical protein